jgi:hypothetical protein
MLRLLRFIKYFKKNRAEKACKTIASTKNIGSYIISQTVTYMAPYMGSIYGPHIWGPYIGPIYGPIYGGHIWGAHIWNMG